MTRVTKVSPKYLQSYLDEYAFRYDHRNDGGCSTLCWFEPPVAKGFRVDPD